MWKEVRRRLELIAAAPVALSVLAAMACLVLLLFLVVGLVTFPIAFVQWSLSRYGIWSGKNIWYDSPVNPWRVEPEPSPQGPPPKGGSGGRPKPKSPKKLQTIPPPRRKGMETGWLICVGNPADGFKLYGAADGAPFQDSDEAGEEADRHFGRGPESWRIVSVFSVSDLPN